MTLIKKLQQAIDALGTFHDAPRTVDVSEGARRMTCELRGLDRLACQLRVLRLQTPELAAASRDRLQAISESLSSRLTYLLEPVSLIEIDSEGCTVQLRSNPPRQEDNGRACYYELLVRRGGEINLCRYRAGDGDREIVPAKLTREVLGRLAADFSAVL